MKSLFFKCCIFCSLFVFPCVSNFSNNLYSVDTTSTNVSRKAALQKQLDSLIEEKEQAELLSRFSEREAFRMMPLDWSSYHRYIALQERSQDKAEAIDLQCKALEKEIQLLSKD